MKISSLVVATAFSYLSLGLSAQAAVLVYEPFDYTAGAGALNGTNGGTGFGGAWAGNGSVVSPGFNYPGLLTMGNRAATSGNGANFRSLGSVFGSGTVYYSLLLQVENAGSTGGYSGFSLFSDEFEILFLGSRGNAGDLLGLERSGNGQNGNTTATVSTVTFAVVKIEFNAGTTAGNERVSLFANPIGNVEPSTPSLLLNDVTNFSFNRIRVDSGRFSGADPTQILNVDEFKVGQAFADVSAVPEPSTIGLLGLTTVGIAALRRRRA